MVRGRSGAARPGRTGAHPCSGRVQAGRDAWLALLVLLLLLLLRRRRERKLLGGLRLRMTALGVLRRGETWRMRERVEGRRRGSGRGRVRRGRVVMLLRAWRRKRALEVRAGLLRGVLREVVVRGRLREVRLLLLLLLLREPGSVLRVLRVRGTDNLARLGRHAACYAHVGRRDGQHRSRRTAGPIHGLPRVHPTWMLLRLLDHPLSLLGLAGHHRSLRRQLSLRLRALPHHRLPLLGRHAILQRLLLLLVVRVALLVRAGVVYAGRGLGRWGAGELRVRLGVVR